MHDFCLLGLPSSLVMLKVTMAIITLTMFHPFIHSSIHPFIQKLTIGNSNNQHALDSLLILYLIHPNNNSFKDGTLEI